MGIYQQYLKFYQTIQKLDVTLKGLKKDMVVSHFEQQFQEFIKQLDQAPQEDSTIESLSLTKMFKRWKAQYLGEIFQEGNVLKLQNLKSLTLSNNQLQLSDLNIIPAKILQNLVKLDLSSNQNTVNENFLMELSNNENLQQLKSLVLKNNQNITNQAIKSIGESRFVKSLEELNLHNCGGLNDEVVTIICASENFKDLKILDLSFNRNMIQLEGFSREDSFLKDIQELYLSNCGIQPMALQNLNSSTFASNLKVLDLSCPFIYTGDFEKDFNYSNILKALVENSSNLGKSLQKLEISKINLHTDELDMFFQSKNFQSLKSLFLNDNQRIKDKGLKNFSQSSFVQNITTLEIKDSELTDKSISQLTQNIIPQLITLDLSYNINLMDKGVLVINNCMREKKLPSLQNLSLAGCNLTEDSIEYLNQNEQSKQLKFLNMRSNPYIKNQGIQKLCAEQQYLLNLEYLNLSNCQISDPGLALLVEKWQGSNNLKDFRISENQFSEEVLTFMSQNIESKFSALQQFIVGSSGQFDFEGKNKFEQRNCLVIPFVGDNLD